ncbi:MAG: hypothetical protein MUF21_13115, partial [Gemmatimonadaceae bacterium]|nr:hypothetical protein [Gemmatimonadaceae bacterium]
LLYLGQPALAIGDPTPANIAVAVLSGLLPVASMLALSRYAKRATWRRADACDVAALVGMLQWSVTLAAAGLLPLTLWR